MKTLTTTTSLWLLVALMFGFLCQDINAGVVQVKQGKPKNATVTSKEATSSTLKPKHGSKVKVATTTTSTTAKPKQDTTTVKPAELDLDGRSAYINNHFVNDQEEPIQENPQPLYDLIQKQMESVLSNTGLNTQLYADSPQPKELTGDNQNAPGKPLFSYNMNQFHEYDEESDNENEGDTLEPEEQQPDNCEDTEESLSENDDDTQYASPQTNQQNNFGQTNTLQQQNTYNQNKPLQNANQRPAKGGPYDSSNYNSPNSNKQDSGYGQTSKPSTSSPSGYYHHHSQKPGVQSQNANHHNQKPTHSHEKPKPPKPSHSSGTNHPSSHHTHHKPLSPHSPHKPSKQTASPASSLENMNKPQDHLEPGQYTPNETTNEPIDNGNFNALSSSPFSTLTPNNSSKPSSNKRHLTFRTVSSSTQYVSTPIADLMLKFSIGMAQPAKSLSLDNQSSQIYDKNDIELSP